MKKNMLLEIILGYRSYSYRSLEVDQKLHD